MPTPLPILGCVWSPGAKVVAAVQFPPGLATPTGATITGGTVNGGAPQAIPAGATVVYVGLPESPAGAGVYGARCTLAGTPLPDAADSPYMIDARSVPAGTDMSDYAAVGAAYAASGTAVEGAGVRDGIAGGMLKSGAWTYAADVVRVNGLPALTPAAVDANVVSVNGLPVTPVTGGGGGGSGSGDTPIDHDGGAGVTVDGAAAGADSLRVTVGGVGVDDVEIAAYLGANYDAGLRGPADRAATTYTGSDGRWEEPLMLDGGEYVIALSRPGYLAQTHRLIVP